MNVFCDGGTTQLLACVMILIGENENKFPNLERSLTKKLNNFLQPHIDIKQN